MANEKQSKAPKKEPLKLTREFVKSLPKAELHCHLDGSMRVETILDIAKKENVKLPTTDHKKLKNILEPGINCKSLEEYLRPFDITAKVLQTEEALIRATYELAEDAAEENIRYLEIRFAPLWHVKKGLSLNRVVEAVIAGKRKAEKKFNIIIGIIICGIRHTTPADSLRVAQLAVAYKNRGVVGYDLAGAEKDFPAKDHKEAFYLIINNNINTTVHAGEAYGTESIDQAIHYINSNRIGHGTRLREDGDLMSYVNDHRIPLEMCISSNLQTKAVEKLEDHPVKFYFDLGLRVTLNTDNRLISGVDLTDEYMLALEELDFTADDLKYLILNGFKSAFLPFSEKISLIKEVTKEMEDKGLIYKKNYI
ncbi:MAG: adenosine deaminase [Bacteroidota bacterium]|nr:adenosine deaminase [Bacteroidota bacterium]